MSLVADTLRRNDPTVTDIEIHLRMETSDAALAQALERNAFVTKIEINFGNGLRHFDWPLLVRAISAREILTDFQLSSHSAPAEALIFQFLNAAHSNANVKKIGFWSFTFAFGSDLFALCARLSASVLVLHYCDMADATQCEPAARALSANTAIETLDLRTSDANGLFIALLRNLITNTSVKTLCTDFRYLIIDDDCSSAVGSLLEATTTLERFELRQAGSLNGENFTPIARGLINSASVCTFSISGAAFNDEGTCVFQKILQDKRNLASLSLKCIFGENNESGLFVLESIATEITRPKSLLRFLEYEPWGFTLDNNSLLILLRVVAKSKLHHFKIGTLNTQMQMQFMTEIVPTLRLQELEMSFCHPLNEQTVNHAMLGAIKKNFCLRSVKGFYRTGPNETRRLFHQVDDQRRLAFYFDRNERLDDWVDNVARLDRTLWPHAIGLAEQAGRDTLFTSLQSVLGSDYVKVRTSGRKRKRS